MIARVFGMLAALAGPCLYGPADASSVTTAPGPQAWCQALSRAVDTSAAGAGPTFVASYLPGPAESSLPGALAVSAFSYDNAVAAVALVACGDVARASRIADAFVAATQHDRTFTDGRVRNAYRAGPLDANPPKLPGWWDPIVKRWDEDAYQDGTSTGNAAWVALALLNVHAVTRRPAYLAAASDLLKWIRDHASEAPGPDGFAGGASGFDDAQVSLRWKSTEHNIDVAAAAGWVHRLTGKSAEAAMASKARGFVSSRFQSQAGFFSLGTGPDGTDADPGRLALDVQLWPILGTANPPPEWRRALGFADAHLRRGDGMTFAGIGPNRWTEGTAQAALAFRQAGAGHVAESLIEGLPAHVSPSGLLYATSAGIVQTGLMVEAQGGGDFNYYHRPHVGATAWAVLAAKGWNPFTGTKVE